MFQFLSLILFPERSIPDSLLHIKDIMLSAAPELDYNTISKDYRKQPFENEHNQVVRWAALLRDFFHRRQLSHTHHTAERAKPIRMKPPPSASIGRKKRLLDKLSGSHDSLKDSKVSILRIACLRGGVADL